MTRFEMEVKGYLGSYWIARALVETAKAVNDAREKAEVEEDGAIRWKESGNYLPDDLCEKLAYAKYPFSRAQTAIKRARQQHEQLEAYRRLRKKLDPETIYEARAAFGKGVPIVDVLTGERFTT